MFKANGALSDGMKELRQGMNAVHSSRQVFGKSAQRYADDSNDVAKATVHPTDAEISISPGD